MAILKDKEEEKGQGTSGVLGQPVPEQQQGMPQEQESSGPANIGGSSATQTSAPVKAMPKQQKAGTGTFANLKSYLQAAQGGGQQRVAKAAAGQVQRLGAGAQKATQQAQKTFGTQMGAGSGAVFQGAEPGKYLTAEEASGQAKADVSDIVGRARATTYQAPQQAQVQTQSATQEGVEAPVQAPTTPAQPQQYFTPEQTQRFADIINAQYQGPQSLQQAGLYDPAAQKARTAQQAGQLTQTALGREQLLRDVFGRGRDYTRGASKLDSILLNTSSKAIEELQKRAEPALQSQQALQAAQNLSANEAAQRASAIEQIRSGAKTAFTESRKQEEAATEERLKGITTEPVIQKDAEGKPILDEAGNPKYIQKLDQYGKPVVDAEGKPVYATEWDLLSQEFTKNLAGNKEINKQLLTEYNKYNDGVTTQQELVNTKKREIDELRKKYPYAKRLDSMYYSLSQEEGKLKRLMQNRDKYVQGMSGQFMLSPEESKFLGLDPQQALFNVAPEAIRSSQYDYSKLVSKDELSRQLALQQLANLDLSRSLQRDLKYTDLEKAGTQTLADSLDKQNLLGFARASDFSPEASMSPELELRSQALQNLLRRQG